MPQRSTVGFLVSTPRTAARGDGQLLPEHAVVALREKLALPNGRLLDAGTVGTIVSVDLDARTYLIEFFEALDGIVAVDADGVRLDP